MSDVQVCYLCRFFWCVLVFGGCGYAVFGLGYSGWLFALAVLICEGDCKSYRTPEQARANPDTDAK